MGNQRLEIGSVVYLPSNPNHLMTVVSDSQRSIHNEDLVDVVWFDDKQHLQTRRLPTKALRSYEK